MLLEPVTRTSVERCNLLTKSNYISHLYKEPNKRHDLGLYVCKRCERIQVIDGILNAEKYIETVLEPKLIPSIRNLFLNKAPFLFQQSSALCHTAKICKGWFKNKSIQLLPWPGNSLDLNPIENLWQRLKILTKKRLSNKTQLIEAIIDS